MLVKVWPKNGNAHLWTYENFKSEVNATLVDFSTNGNIIKYIIYEIPQPIPKSIFSKYGFNYRILKSYKSNNTSNRT